MSVTLCGMHRNTTARVVGALFLTASAAGALSLTLSGPGRALLVLVMAVAIALIAPVLFPVLKEYGEALALGYVVARVVEAVLILMLQAQDEWVYAGSSVFFCLSAVLLNVLLLRSRLVPRWIAVWALVAVVAYLADALLVMFGAIALSSVAHGVLVAPLALNELVLAVWLLAKGFPARTVVG